MLKKILFSILLILILVPSCKKNDQSKSTKVVGITLLTTAHMFYRDLEEGLRATASKYNYELVITSADFDLGKQINQIEDFISRKVDVIVVCPVDSRGVGLGIKKANDANIPVFTADIASEEGNVVCHIASDNVAGGRLAGEYLAKILNGKGNIAIINQPAITSVLDRVKGFREVIDKFPNIKIVADVNGQGVRDKALQVASDILQAHPKLDGIFGINDDSALGALDAVRQFKRENVVIVGYDATPLAVDAILKNSQLKADVIQYPDKIGFYTIEKIKEYFDGKSLPKVFPVEVGIVDKTALENKK